MNEPKEFNTLPVLSEVQEERERAQKKPAIASVRVSPGPYLALASVLTFVAALALRAQQDLAALILICRSVADSSGACAMRSHRVRRHVAATPGSSGILTPSAFWISQTTFDRRL